LLVARPFLLLLVFVAGFLTFVAAGLLVFALLASSGGPDDPVGACRNTELDLESPESPGLRDVVTDPALAQTWQERWNAFRSEVDAGQGISITFEESEVTSRATRWLGDEDIPLKRVTICFYDGEAEARATAEVPVVSDIPFLGGIFETEVAARGNIDLSGEHPRIDITGLDAGKLPGFATGLVEDDIESLLNGQLEELTLSRAYDITFRETQAEITAR
jgi:hypothetical protein